MTGCRQLDKFKLPDLITMLFALAKLGSPVDASVAEAAAHAAGSRGITLQASRGIRTEQAYKGLGAF